MSTTGTVVEVTGEVWARGADGSLRRLSAGDELTGTETLILAAGAALVVRSGSGADAEVVTLEGPESGFLIVPPDGTDPFLASPDLASMIQEDLLADGEREEEPDLDPAPRLGDGHRFVQLVRIEDDLETDSIAPLNLARNREVLRPMTIDWADPVEEELVQRYSSGRNDEQPVNRAPVLAPDTRTIQEDETASGNVVDNDSDPENRALTVTQFEIGGQIFAAGEQATIAGIGEVLINADGSYSFTPVPDWSGTVPTVTYTVDDGRGSIGTSTLDIVVEPVSDIVPDAITTQSGDPVTVDVLDNDTFENGGAAVTAISQGGHGTVVINPDGTITYTPDPGYVGPDSYTYTVTSGGGTETTTVTVEVTNEPPAPLPETETTAEDTPLSGNVLENDVDPNGHPLVVTAFEIGGQAYTAGQTATIPGVGTLVIGPGGAYTFVPEKDWNGTVPTVTYTVSDGNDGGTATSTLDIVVTPVNDPPVATPLPGQSDSDADPVSGVDVKAGFSDPEGDVLTYTATGLPPGLVLDPVTGLVGGTIDSSASQSGTAGNPPGVYTVVVTADDGNGGTVSQSFEWTVSNPAPEAIDDSGTTDENTALVVSAAGGVLGNDSDPDGDTLTVSAVNGASASVGSTVAGTGGGRFTLNADGSYAFTPDGEFDDLAVGETRTTSVTYTISDGEGGTDTATLLVTVTGTNDGPVAVGTLPGQSNEDADTVVSIDVTAAFADVDASDTLTYTATGLPPGLTLDPVTGRISGTIDNSASQSGTAGNPLGVYTVVVTADDGHGGTVSQSFDWTVSNPVPEAIDDAGTTDENTALVVSAAGGVLGNDSDPDGDALTVSAVNGIAAGVGSSVGGTGGGAFILGADGSYTFDPNGEFDDLAVGETRTTSVTYTISDGEGGTDTATLVVTVTGTNDGPVAVGMLPAQANEDAETVVTIDVTSAFAEVDASDTLTYTATGLPPGLTLDPVTGIIGGTIDNSASQSGTTGNPPGVYTVVVTADDGNGGTVTQSFEWTVSNPVPDALDDARTTDEDTPLSATAANGLLGNDSDPDGDALVVSEVNGITGNVGAAVAGNGGGTFILNADGSYTFDPNGEFDDLSVGETRTTSVTYTIDDGEGGSDTATFEVTVTGINDPPVAADDVDATDEDTPLAVDAAGGVLGNDSDPEGDPLTVSAVNGTAAGVGALLAGTGGGTFTLAADGSYVFDPNDEFEDLAVGETRTTSVTYTISDGEGGTDTATLTVTVTGTNDGPVAVGTLPGQANDDADAVVTVDIASAFTDADTSDTLTYTATGLPPGLTLDPVTGIISGTIDNSASQSSTGGNPAGVYTVVVTADDGHGGTVTQSFDWTVTNPAPQAAADNGTVTEDGPDLVVSAANGVIASGAAVAGTDTDPDGDALSVTHVMAGTAAGLGDFPGAPNAGTQIVGTYGTLTIAADGSYTYVLDNANPLVNGLDAASAPLSDVFSYAISDGEGGTSFTTLTITINGNDDGAPSITPTDANGIDPGQLTVYEAGLTTDGPIGHTADASGSIVISAGNGLVGIAIGATALTLAQLEAITPGSPIVIDTPQGRLTLTGYVSSGEIGGVSTGGTLSYTYTLEDTVTNPDPASDGSSEVIELSVEDAAGRTNTADFTINIVDDVPTSGAPDPATVDEANLTGGTDTNPGALTVTGSLDIRTGADGGSLDTVFDAAQAGLAGLTSNGIPLDYEISLDGHTLTATAGPGGAVVFTVTLTNPNSPAAAYGFVLSGPLDHGASPLDLSFAFTVTDADGDSDTNSFQVTVLDDGPIAVDQAGLFLEEGGAVVGSASGGANLLGNDTAGADGAAKVISITYTDESGSSATAAVPLGGVTVDTRYGSLTVNPDGTWSYTSDATEDNAAGVAESFSYTVEDYDGSTSSAVQPLTVTDTDPTPGVVSLGIDERDVPGAGSAGSSTNSVTESMGIVKGPDAIEDVVFDASTVSGLEAQNLTSGGTPLVYTVSGDGHVLTARAGAAVVFTLTLNNPADPSGASQSITMALTGKLDHPAANGENALSIPVGYTLHDTDSSVTAMLELTVVDDVPTAQAGPIATVVEGGQTVVGTALLAGDIQGADGARLYQVQYTNEAGNPTVATVAAGPGGSTFDTIHGSLTVRQDGTWSYTSDPVVSSGTSVSHPQPGSDLSVDEVFSYNLIDGDGDVSGWADQTVTVTDTVPSIGSPEAEVVSEANLPSGSDPDGPALTRTGSLDVTKAADGIDVTFAAVQEALGDLALTSGGVALVYTVSAGGHTLTATAGAGGPVVFTATIVNPTSASASYSFVLSRPLDHTAGTDIELPIAFGVVDGDGDRDDGNFIIITVTDDGPQPDREILLNEDSAGITFNTSADATGSNVSTSDPANGTATVNANGTITYVPDANFSGTDTFTYTTVADDGSNVVTTVTATVNPISDAPQVPLDSGTVGTNEDEAVALGLNAPVVTDAVDQNGAGAGDNPELLGAITLTGIPNGAQLLDGSGNLLFTSTGAPITIQLSDGPHIQGIASDLTMTSATYEGLRILPPAESHANFTIAVSVTSYEVDDAGIPLAGVPGATSSANVTVTVQAVTDPITLALVDGGDPDASASDHTFAEDSTFNLANLLSVGFPSTDGNGGADVDGSEVRWFEISGLPLGTTVNGVTVTVGNPAITVAAPGLSTSSTGLPAMTITPPADFSGDVTITVTLFAQDGDADGVGSGATTGGLVQESVTLDLHVTPVGGDVTATGVTVAEDALAAFLSGIRVTDEGGNGTELITEIEFEVPAGWTVTDTGSGTGYTVGLVGTTYTIAFDSTLTQAQREAALDGFRIEGPAHSSANVTIDVAVTTADTVSIDGGNVTDTTTTNLPVTVTVTPVAELVAGDSDGDGNADAIMTPGRVYTTPGEEDAWFTLGTEEGFNLGTGWSNQDINEQVFARLTPELISGDGGANNAIGAQFRYSTNGNTSEGGGAWVTVTYAGTPVDIPVAYLNTLQFKAPEDLSGTFEIDVQTLTRDTDPDTGATVQAVSGSAVLSNLVIEPAADEVTVALNARANGIEDTAISLEIRPTSSDPSETFTVTIADIPAGAQLFYDGVLQTLTAGSVTIEEFDSTKPLTLQPPLNSNADFTLSVSAFSVDGADISGTQTLGVNVSLKGVADVATVTVLGASYSEAALDSGSDQVLLSELISTTLHDDDTSEVLTLRVTGLPQGFSLSEGTMLVGGAGAERVWVLTQQQFATVRVSTPANYSGTQTFSVTPVTTENDGDSRTGAPQTVSIVVTPSTEAAVATSATLDEDTLTPLGLAIVHQNGDTDETLTTVWIAVDDAVSAGFSLYLGSTLLAGAGLPITDIGGQDYYVLTGSQIAQLSAKAAANLDGSLGSFDFKYEITDQNFVGTPAGATTTTVHDGVFELTADPVTDPIDVSITAIAGTGGITTTSDEHAGDDAAPDTASLTAGDLVTVTLNIAPVADAGSAGGTADSDGSEKVIRVVIEGVPDGVSVQGAEYSGAGTWLLIYNDATALPIDDAGGISLPVVFDVSGFAGGLDNVPITIQVQSQDGEQGAGTAILSDSVTWRLSTNFAPGEGALPALIDQWAYNGAHAAEDTAFALSDVIDAQVTVRDAGVPNVFTVTLTDVPAGTIIDGMTMTVVNGVQVWTASTTVAPGGDANAALSDLLDSIEITAPEDSNENNAPETFHLDARLTVSVPNGGNARADIDDMTVPVDPVTDAGVITIVADTIDEGVASIPVTFTVGNDADGVFGGIVDGKLYVKVDVAGSTNGLENGTLTWNGAAIATEVVGGELYYVVTGVTAGVSVELVYTPDNSTAGEVSFSAVVRTQEAGSAVIQTGTGSGTAQVIMINNGVTISSAASSGTESNQVPITGLVVSLVDDDGSETINSILLSNVPNGFLVYVGSSAGTATLASNAGGDNTWVISNPDGSLPAYVAILPPEHWSGTLDSLTVTVESGETAFSDGIIQNFELGDVTITAVANGVDLTATNTFGPENQIIPLNLNASMADPADASVPGAVDANQETTTLRLTGLGEFASFYIGAAQKVAGVSYHAGSDTYTLTGLTQSDLDQLGFLQARNAMTDKDLTTSGIQIAVEAFTSDGLSISATDSAFLTVSSFAQLATSGNDSLLWTGSAIDAGAGTDTLRLRHGENLSGSELDSRLSNVEVLDLHGNSVDSLSAADVLGIAGSTSVLSILGDSADSLSLAAGWTAAGTQQIGGIDYAIYTASVGMTNVELHVQSGITVE